MRSMHRSRYYVQCSLDDQVDQWPTKSSGMSLKRRLDREAVDNLVTGPSIEKSIAPLRSFVAEPMRFGGCCLPATPRIIVPPTGAKGLNLPPAYVHYLSQALREYYDENSSPDRWLFREGAGRVWKRWLFLVDDRDVASVSDTEGFAHGSSWPSWIIS